MEVKVGLNKEAFEILHGQVDVKGYCWSGQENRIEVDMKLGDLCSVFKDSIKDTSVRVFLLDQETPQLVTGFLEGNVVLSETL